MAIDDRFAYPEPTGEEPEGVRSEIITGPVSDWATDFSHLEPEWSADPYPIQEDLRQRCPIAHTGRFGGGPLRLQMGEVGRPVRDRAGDDLAAGPDDLLLAGVPEVFGEPVIGGHVTPPRAGQWRVRDS